MEIRVHGLRYQVQIAGEGPALLLLHGFTGAGDNWLPLLPVFTPHFRTIRVDLIGHGGTESPGDLERYRVEPAAADLAAILDELGEKSVLLLGYSMGGRLALSFAMLYPERVERLLLESSSPGLASSEERRKRRQSDEVLANRIETSGLEAFVDSWEKIPLFASQQGLPQTVRDEIRKQRLANNPVGLANSLRGIGTGAQPSWWDKLPQLKIPVMLLVGEKDTKFRHIGEEMIKRLPDARLENIPLSGHTIHVEQTRLFGTIVMDFLE
ncbi:2-succinyl-6-hydroxy-2,4-cyclohexadiene-1-carboxylate synthase [Marininema mesophilum]|uniref:Putative 2-succinyl-6-hydroxy-2,4-cyclohexadiene-1-carboxylate synthase n=1 Tax=Marininema mesophilum TaxID=1048340 RepID=A0A1H3A2G9_9BACL|nr:2-succinyl-6-hydroxy-2,4-cyclohexadiene-1-carboxylate synthase [Marininema mesophilum]SDX23099.1 2-succinyl-6-hydroxy-2,4-cyclohexadiene-1-carboxylate synthase [Marininema mesophilum]